jgi:hypothetical protein
VPQPTSRALVVLLACALLVGALAAAAAHGTRRALSHERTSARALDVELGTPLGPARLAAADVNWLGGPTTTSTGETVDVRVSAALPVEAASPSRWAEFLTGLTHGSEISKLTAYIATLDEVQETCGSNALGCYGQNQLIAPGETAAIDVSPDEIIRHEYGHHIALNRSNPPWTAIDWGPKRWASAQNICARVEGRQAYPGDEGSNYRLNPGEAWAETYRLLEERKAGITTASWPIVSPTFFPSEQALSAAEEDVLQPWTASQTTSTTHIFGKRTPKVWWTPLSTPLDGSLRITATVPRGGTYDVALVAANHRTVVGRAQWVGQRAKRFDGSVCGQRSFFVRVTQKGTLGRVRVSATTP